MTGYRRVSITCRGDISWLKHRRPIPHGCACDEQQGHPNYQDVGLAHGILGTLRLVFRVKGSYLDVSWDMLNVSESCLQSMGDPEL